MPVFCKFGIHSWNDCTCRLCGKVRDTDHRWTKCKCVACGKTRDSEHDWSGCACRLCGKVRDPPLDQMQMRCTEHRDYNQTETACATCGSTLDTIEVARIWAAKLTARRDYHALAAYMCAYGKHPDSDFGYRRSVDLWNDRRRFASEALLQAGNEAVDAMLAELEKGESKDWRVAEILIKIGNPKAVPLLQRLLDRGQWSATGGADSEVAAFIRSFAGLPSVEPESVCCSVCNRRVSVREAKNCSGRDHVEHWFCAAGQCWGKRGPIVRLGNATTCPYFENYACKSKHGLEICRLEDHPYTVCPAYRREGVG